MKIFSKFILALVISLLSFNLVYANPPTVTKELKYLIKIHSTDPNRQVKLVGHYLTTDKSGTKMTTIDQLTPYETTVKADVIGFMLMVAESAAPAIQFELANIDHGGEHTLMSGSGGAIFAHEDAEGNAYITTR